MVPRIARKWHKPVPNAILWEKMQKLKIMLDFRLFAVKRHEIFTSPVFKNPGIYNFLLFFSTSVIKAFVLTVIIFVTL